MKFTDRELGMDRAITRRDFLNGASVAIGGAGAIGAMRPADAHAASDSSVATSPKRGFQDADEHYPPGLTGMRGSHEGSFEVAHEMRYGKTWDNPEDTGEIYDLIVVGGGLSGLAAAYYFKKALPESKVLVLDNHDDFGGHAKRNEVMVNGHQIIGTGGTSYITGAYTPEGETLLEEIGIDPHRFHKLGGERGVLAGEYGLMNAVFFDEENFGEDRLVVGVPGRRASGAPPLSWAEFLAKTPLPRQGQQDIVDLYESPRDYMPGASVDERVRRLKKMSYRDFLVDLVGVDASVVKYFWHSPDSNGVAGIDTQSAWGAFRSGWVPGLDAMGLERPPRNWLEGHDNPWEGIKFPDGNAGIARLIVRWLIPDALPGTTMEDSVAAHVRYGELDKPSNAVRIRLSSTVVNARHRGERRTAGEVEVTYVQDGKARRVRGGTCVMACYNAMIPYLCPDFPQEQKTALKWAVRKPYVSTNVVLRDWRAFHELGIARISCPLGYHQSISLSDWAPSIGDYERSQNPEHPMNLHLSFVPIKPGLPPKDQFRAGREELLATTFETVERKTRDQLARALDGSGFDPVRDIEAIICNRWPHGYAGAANDLYDPDWGYDEAPWVMGRKRFGRIAVANSDAAATCLTQAAFDQAHRAVQELVTDVIRPEFQYPWAERT